MLTLASIRSLPAFFLCLSMLNGFLPPAQAATLHVSPSGSDDNSGSLAAPYKTIQAAVDNAQAGDTISLAPAVYQGKGNRDIEVAGKRLSLEAQSGPGKAILDCQGTQKLPHYAFSFQGQETAVVLAGLSIKNATGEPFITLGQGAIRVGTGCTLTLRECFFRNNSNGCLFNDGTATLTDCLFLQNPAGGGVLNRRTITLTGCTFAGNLGGGGMINMGAAALTHCTFTGNTCTRYAGLSSAGGLSTGGTATLSGCTFTGNRSTAPGGGVNNYQTITLTGCVFSGNTSPEGAGMFTNGRAALSGCTFRGNRCTLSGGGGIENGNTATLTNCVVSRNSAAGSGGGIWNRGTAVIRACTVFGNTAQPASLQRSPARGGGLENDGTATLTDNILWGNSAPDAAQFGTSASGGQTTATFCDIQGGWSGTGNLKTDPRFADAAHGDLHLQAGSACRGAGIAIPAAAADPRQSDPADSGVTFDAQGNPRPNPPSMGAFESAAP